MRNEGDMTWLIKSDLFQFCFAFAMPAIENVHEKTTTSKINKSRDETNPE